MGPGKSQKITGSETKGFIPQGIKGICMFAPVALSLMFHEDLAMGPDGW